MNKSKYYFLLVGIIVFVWGCQKQNQFVIKGKITHAEGQMIYLEELFVTNSEAIDSVKINKKGEFEFKSNVSIPTFSIHSDLNVLQVPTSNNASFIDNSFILQIY